VVTTPSGERFLAAARVLLSARDDFSRTLGALAEPASQPLRIGCFEPFGPVFMSDLLRRYVDKVGTSDIQLFEGHQAQLQEWLSTGVVDLVVAYDIGPKLSGSSIPICRVPLHAILHADDPLAREPAISLKDLATRPLVLLDLPHTVTFLLTVFDILASRPQIALRTRSYETVRAAVAQGFGVSLLNLRPISAANADPKTVVRRPIIEDLPIPTLQITDVYGARKPTHVKAFTTIARNFFAELGPRRFAITTPEREALL
jgi:DNA-binding transcriptional LysR family regulator